MTPYNVLIQWKRCFKLAKIITANILYKTATTTLNKPLFNGVQVRVVLNWYLFFICFHLLFCNILHQRVLLARLFPNIVINRTAFLCVRRQRLLAAAQALSFFIPTSVWLYALLLFFFAFHHIFQSYFLCTLYPRFLCYMTWRILPTEKSNAAHMTHIVSVGFTAGYMIDYVFKRKRTTADKWWYTIHFKLSFVDQKNPSKRSNVLFVYSPKSDQCSNCKWRNTIKCKTIEKI